jgi:type II secretory pathway predicted ATPase ExeA
MYEAYFGLRERPFDLTANPRFLFLTTQHREALSTLQYGITAQKGVTVLVGEAGTGKTTLVRAALESLAGTGSRAIYLNNPTLTRAEFVEFLAEQFDLSPEGARSKARFLSEITQVLTERQRQGQPTALLVDEAQSLPNELLEEIRLLSNIETPTAKLLPIVLVGQPELATRLNDLHLRQLKQRVALRCTLHPLSLHETAAYIAKRLRIAGGDGAGIFTREAVEAVYEASAGIPRTISVVCDNALVSAFALDRRPVDADTVHDVCRDFDLERPTLVMHAAPPVDAEARIAPVARVVANPVAPAMAQPRPAPEPAEEPAAATGREFFSVFTKRRRFSFF